MQLNPELVKRSLAAHSSIGLVVGVIMYLVCLTGALAALAETFERWEQPAVPEFYIASPEAVDTAITQYRTQIEASPSSLWVVFPTPELPRMHVTDGDQERFTDANGNLHEAPVEAWTHMLRELHLRLHLPSNIGLIIVSTAGVMLLALIVSGLFSHPRLFKDAFKFRLGGSRRLEQADIHNRLSVWGLPFHLMIAVTGAFYGLVGLLVFSAATAWYDGDNNALFDAVYGADPVIEAPLQAIDTGNALAQLSQYHPDVSPIYIVAHELDTPGQFMEIAATVPGRLSYSEIYRFDAAGNYMGSQELSSGPSGRQFLYSLYRIHFGYFGGQATRIIWLLLGLALTVVSATGVNIWLAKRAQDDWVDRAWTATVWGAPLALVVSAMGALFAGLSPLPYFLAALLASIFASFFSSDTLRLRAILLGLCALAMLTLSSTHLTNFPPGDYGRYLFWVNGSIAVSAIVLAYMSWRGFVRR